jgi:hypothetical protein
MRGRTIHRSGTVVLSLLMLAIGLALIGQVIGGGELLSARLLLGLLFATAGVARLYIERKRSREP